MGGIESWGRDVTTDAWCLRFHAAPTELGGEGVLLVTINIALLTELDWDAAHMEQHKVRTPRGLWKSSLPFGLKICCRKLLRAGFVLLYSQALFPCLGKSREFLTKP